MESEYGKAYARLYREHWWWRAREDFLMRVIKRLGLPAKPNVLDIGCGNGLFFDRLAELGGTVEGVEFDRSLISAEANQRYRIHVGPFDDSFTTNKKYSLVLMLDVLEHLADPQAALGQVARLLEADGRIVLTVPAFLSLWTTHDEINHHFTRYTKNTLKTLALAANLRVDRMQYFFHWLVPIKLAIRLKEYILATTPSAARIPAPVVNRAMLYISRVEQRLFSCCPLPIGSSLLMVGRRK